MNSSPRHYGKIIVLILFSVTLLTAAALIFGYLFRPDNENLSRAGSFAGVIGTTLGVLIAAYAIFIEWRRAELRHEEANEAWAASIRLQHAIATLDWLLPDACQKAWIIANCCRPSSRGKAWVVRELGTAGLPGGTGDSYLTGLQELDRALEGAIAKGLGRVLGVSWNSEAWNNEDHNERASGVLSVAVLLDLKASVEMLISQRQSGWMSLPDALTLAQMQALFRSLTAPLVEVKSVSRRRATAPNLALMHEFRRAFEDDKFNYLSEDTYIDFYIESYAQWMGESLPFVGFALPVHVKGSADSLTWLPLGESDRPILTAPSTLATNFFSGFPHKSFDASGATALAALVESSYSDALAPEFWDSTDLAARLRAESTKGNAEATNALGVLFACIGKPENLSNKYFKLAVDQGSGHAMANVGAQLYNLALKNSTVSNSPASVGDNPTAMEDLHWAAGYFMKARRQFPNHPQALMFDGFVAFKESNLGLASDHFRRAFDEGWFQAAGSLLILEASQGNFTEALDWRDAQATFIENFIADSPLEVLAILLGYSIDLSLALNPRVGR